MRSRLATFALIAAEHPVVTARATSSRYKEVLIPEDQMIVSDAPLTRVTQKNPDVRWSEMGWTLKEAYARHVALLDRDRRLQLGVANLSEPIVFYNAYYWALVFGMRYVARHGFDAGVEQQAFGVLECAPTDVDWQMVEYVAQIANRQQDRPLS